MPAPPKNAAAAPSLVRYRLDIAARVFAATGVNYALCALFAATLGVGLASAGVARVDAVIGAITLAFLLFAAVAVWVFSCASSVRMWSVLLAALGVFAALSAWVAPPDVPAAAPAPAATSAGPSTSPSANSPSANSPMNPSTPARARRNAAGSADALDAQGE